MPLNHCKLKATDWNLLTEKINKEMVGWKGKMLSIAGHAILHNAVITPDILDVLFHFALECNQKNR